MQDNNDYIPVNEEHVSKKKINPFLIIIPSAILIIVTVGVLAALIFFNNPKNKVMRAFAVALGDSFPFAEYVKGFNPVSAKRSFFDNAETMGRIRDACDNKQFYTENSLKLNSAKTPSSSATTSTLSGIKLNSALYFDTPGRRIQYRLTPGYTIIKGPEFIFTQNDNIFSFHSPSLIDTPLTIDTENFGPDYNASEFADIIGYRFPSNIENDIRFNLFDMLEEYDASDISLSDTVNKSSLKALYDAIEVKKTGKKELISTEAGQSEECSEYLVTLPGKEMSDIIMPLLQSYDDRNNSFIKDNTDLLSALCVAAGTDMDTLFEDYDNEKDSFLTKIEDMLSDDLSMTVWLNSKDELRKAECDLFTWELAGSETSEGSYMLSIYYSDGSHADPDVIITKNNTFIKNKTKAQSNRSEYDIHIYDVTSDTELFNISYLADYDCENNSMKISGSIAYEDRKLTLDGDCDVTIENENGAAITFDFDHILLDYSEGGNAVCNIDISEEFTLSELNYGVYEDLPSSGTPLFKMSRNEFYTTISDGLNNYLNNSWAFSGTGASTVTPDQVEALFSNPLLLYLIGSGL